MEYTKYEEEMLEAYATFRIDGMSKIQATMYLFEMGYKPTHNVMEAIKTKDKYIFAFNQ